MLKNLIQLFVNFMFVGAFWLVVALVLVFINPQSAKVLVEVNGVCFIIALFGWLILVLNAVQEDE